MSPARLRWLCLSGLALFLAGCGIGSQTAAATRATVTATASFTPSPSPTATPTPTPTATALPAAIEGDPRSLSLSEPVHQSGAPCGFVDTFDFPLDPPDGAAATGGSDFGRFRDRYDGYHAGEDWRLGRPSFGQPVYSIGHGQVVYAQPLGWGADKGVVIVQHTYRDRGRILSFYGHLDPPSVDLRAGQCVARGELVGRIGEPRTSPHLHFEIRVHLADTPGPGYWPVDPRLAGWRPPSATIWDERIAVLPGVDWTHLSDSSLLQPLGQVEEMLLLYADQQLLALNRADGRVGWTRTLPEGTRQVVLDAGGTQLYRADLAGTIEALLPGELEFGAAASAEPLWQLEWRVAGDPQLIPMPGGGLLAVSHSRLSAISGAGQILWDSEGLANLYDWAQTEGGLVLASVEGIEVADPEGVWQLDSTVHAQRVVASAQPYLYADDGLYRLDTGTHAVALIYSLPLGFPGVGDLAELPDGSLLVAHRDPSDTRLIAIGVDGSVLWERSIRALSASRLQLVAIGDVVYLLVVVDLGNATGIDLFQIDLEDGGLLRLFSGGTRAGDSDPVITRVVENSLLISIAGVGVAEWTPALALAAMSNR